MRRCRPRYSCENRSPVFVACSGSRLLPKRRDIGRIKQFESRRVNPYSDDYALNPDVERPLPVWGSLYRHGSILCQAAGFCHLTPPEGVEPRSYANSLHAGGPLEDTRFFWIRDDLPHSLSRDMVRTPVLLRLDVFPGPKASLYTGSNGGTGTGLPQASRVPDLRSTVPVNDLHEGRPSLLRTSVAALSRTVERTRLLRSLVAATSLFVVLTAQIDDWRAS